MISLSHVQRVARGTANVRLHWGYTCSPDNMQGHLDDGGEVRILADVLLAGDYLQLGTVFLQVEDWLRLLVQQPAHGQIL